MFIQNNDKAWFITIRNVTGIGGGKQTFAVRFWGMIAAAQSGTLQVTVIPFYLNDGKLIGATDGKLSYEDPTITNFDSYEKPR